MKDISWWKLFWLYIVTVFTLEIILATVFSLRSGIIETFPYLYILPIILLARLHPRFAIYFTIVLGWIYLGLVFFFMPFEIKSFASSIAWFYIFVTIGVVISSLAESGKQEAKFREMFDNSLAGIFSVDLETKKFTELNARTASILGFDPAELAGKEFSLAWRDEKDLEGFLRQFTADKISEPVEVTFRKKDGKIVWVLLTASPAGSSHMVCSVIDITEKKVIRDNLIESELRYHMLFDSAADVIFIHDTGGKILNANQTASRRSGYSVQKLQELRLQDLGLVSECGLTPAQNTELQSRGLYLFESLLMSRDGTPLPVEISCKIIEYAGKPAVLSTLRDITERRHAQAALIESEMRYRMIGELIPFGVWSCDEGGNYTYLSESFLSLLGVTLDDCKKNGWMHLLPREDYDRTLSDWKQCIQTGSFWDYEYRIVDRKGKVFIVLSRGAPHMDSTGKITSWVGIHIDITDRKRYEERLETSLREKEVIIKEVHHRVKNNMQVISGFLELQSNYITDPVSIEKLAECQQRVRTMALVHEKLYQAKNLGYINASEYVKSLVLDLTNSYMLRSDILINTDVDDANITLDMAIPCGLIINELVTNALKYAFKDRSGGSIAVGLHLGPDHHFNLIVEDDGIGIPPGFSVEKSPTLGLQLVNVLVKQLGGSVVVTGGKGTRFAITFPEKF
jgi:PAS domain S-box-containing protein